VRDLLALVVVNGLFAAVGTVGLIALGYVPAARSAWRPALAAVGPAVLIGAALVIPTAIICLVAGIPVTLVTVVLIGLAWVATLWVYRRWRDRASEDATPRSAENGSPPAPAAADRARSGRDLSAIGLRVVLAGVAVYAVLGAWALARVPTRGDDARIWSLRGLTLSYYDFLKPEVFLNPIQSGGHAVYPLFQPLLEATLARAAGHPALRVIHAELWLVFVLAVWTAGYLLWHAIPLRPPWDRWRVVALAALATLALTQYAILNIVVGDADTTGSVLLAVGVLGLGLWLDTADRRCLAVGTLMLAAAASTKDEDLTAAVTVLVLVLAVAIAGKLRRSGWRHGWRTLWPAFAAAGGFVVAVAPWRIWLAAHHLTDTVQPPLPRALNPGYVLGRSAELNRTATAMITQVQLHWNWLAAIFLAACAVALVTGVGRRAAAVYLGIFLVIVAELLWLYTTTPLSLDFLIPTSMDRTVSVFMALTPLATAHLLLSFVTDMSEATRGAQAADAPAARERLGLLSRHGRSR
jgi:hypothetical protein